MSAVRTSRFHLVLFIVAALCCLHARGGAAAGDERTERLPERYRDWIEKEVVYIISDKERDAFLDLASVEEWDAFIDAFWRQRDPDPLTPVNELEEEHYRRLEYANTILGRDSAVPGWMTDRGKMYIILGEPDDKDSFRSVPGLYPAEVWFYLANKEKALPPLLLLFFQEGHAGPYRLFNHAVDGIEKLIPSAAFSVMNDRLALYQQLQTISPELAQASVTARADRSAYGYVFDRESAALDFMALLGDIYVSPHRRVDTRYVDAAGRGRGLVETEYLFNYVPSSGTADVIPGPNGTSFVHYSIELEPQHLTLARDGSDYYTTFDLSGEITTPNGEKTILRLVKERFVKLTESQFQQVSYRPFAYRNMFPLVAGDFNFRVVLKNRARSEYTIFEAPLHVAVREGGVALGDPVLLYDAPVSPDSEGGGDAYRTYQIGSMELDPNARRIFAIGEDVVVYVPVENAGEDDVLSFRIESAEPSSLEPLARSRRFGEYPDARAIESLSTEALESGRYRLAVELDDGDGKAVAVRSVAFDVIPRTRVLPPWSLSDSIDGTEAGPVFASLAEQYLNLGDLAKAREMSRRSLAEDPSATAPRVFLARVALDEGKPEEAIALLEPAVRTEDNDVDLLLTLGDAYVRVADYANASARLEAAVTLRRPTPALLNALAACFHELGNLEKARQYLEQSLTLDPQQEKVQLLLERMKSSSPP